MIRLATLDDVPVISEIGERFHAAAGWPQIACYVRQDCEQTLRHLVEGPDGIILVAEEEGQIIGIAGGFAHPMYFNLSHKTGVELFLWVEPDRRGTVGIRLLKTLENEGRALGCQSWSMIAMETIAPAATGKLYEREGYRAMEHVYVKEL